MDTNEEVSMTNGLLVPEPADSWRRFCTLNHHARRPWGKRVEAYSQPRTPEVPPKAMIDRKEGQVLHRCGSPHRFRRQIS